MDAKAQNGERKNLSIKLWPPSVNTRNTLVERMKNNLSTPTIFTRKYGTLTEAEALNHSKEIEEVAFTTANHHYEQEPDGDGSSAVQFYARECSRLILDVLKGESATLEKTVGSQVEDSAPKETFFDISKGPRAFIEEEEARTLLSPLKEPGNSYTKICFSNRSFGLGAAKVAGPILASIKHQLKEVDLSDFVAGRPEAEALEVMSIFSEALEGCELKCLDISHNALGEKGVRAFGQLLKSQSSLEELYLMNDGISTEAAEAVSELVPSTEKLKVLHFHNNMTGDEGAAFIAEIVRRCPLLEDFRCSSTRVASEGCLAIAESLKQCKNLKKIDLRDNMCGTEAGVRIAEAISSLEHLTEIYLSYLNLEDDGAIAISEALTNSPSPLQVLEMAGNDITAEAAPALVALISSKKSLVKLNLSENELKDEGAIKISNALGEGHGQLLEVDMSQTSLTTAGARALARALIDKPSFKLLNVDGNYISDEGVDELRTVFKGCPEKLGPFDENDPDGEGLDDKESGEEDEGSQDELEAQLQKLSVDGDD